MRHQERFVMSRIEDRGSEIMAMGRNMEKRMPGATRMAQDAVANGWTVDLFRSELLEKLPSARPMQPSIDPLRDVSGWAKANYSITKAVDGLMRGKLEGLEREISDEIALKNGVKAEGVFVPDGMLAQRSAVAGVGTLGGMAVSTPTIGSEFIEYLKSPVVAARLGARILPLGSPVLLPKMAGSSTVNWQNGETSASTLSAVEFGSVTLTPRVVTGQLQFSRQLAITSSVAIDALFTQDLLENIALAIDRAVFHGSGSSGEPSGLDNVADLNVVTLSANGSALTTANAWGAFVSLESQVCADNSGINGYVVDAATRGKLKTLSRTGTGDKLCWDMENPERPLNGYRVEMSNQLIRNSTVGSATTLCSCAYAGNWSDCIIAEWGGGVSDVVLDQFTLAQNRTLRLFVSKHCDVAFRRGSSFSKLIGIIN
jgi:HK97 family phage major capsid protein